MFHTGGQGAQTCVVSCMLPCFPKEYECYKPSTLSLHTSFSHPCVGSLSCWVIYLGYPVNILLLVFPPTLLGRRSGLESRIQTLCNSKVMMAAANVGCIMIYNMNCLVNFVLKHLCKEMKSLDSRNGSVNLF